MKQKLEQNLGVAVKQYLQYHSPELDNPPVIELEHAKDPKHGDFATNIAMALAKPIGKPPREIAKDIIGLLPETPFLDRTEIAGPGFINFHLSSEAWLQDIREILSAGKNYGRSDFGGGEKILIEYVSSNPTGPVHIGHGRGAAYGSVLARLLEEAGFDVTTEYYVNDAGRQMDILAASVWMRYLQLRTIPEISLPPSAYQGEYVKDIATGLNTARHNFAEPAKEIILTIINSAINEDKKIDQIVSLAKSTLGEKDYEFLFRCALDGILESIRIDLLEFGVTFDNWFSERALIESGAIHNCLEKMKINGDLYEMDGATWFRSTEYGDEKDRVVIRENGQTTYFASDIAYHIEKFQRGFKQIINIWGADHHGYIARVKGALSSLGENPEKLKILLVQFATLYRGKEKLQMSTRSGEYVTLKELRDEVGNDATRFFYVSRKSEQHLDFDLELAKSQSNDNPVYYIQYAHARICSVLRQMEERGLDFDLQTGQDNLVLLNEILERDLVKTLSRYAEVVVSAAGNHEPHLLAFYLREVANDFHAYYNSCQFIVDDIKIRNARICLIMAARQIIGNGLDLLGVSSPEKM